MKVEDTSSKHDAICHMLPMVHHHDFIELYHVQYHVLSLVKIRQAYRRNTSGLLLPMIGQKFSIYHVNSKEEKDELYVPLDSRKSFP